MRKHYSCWLYRAFLTSDSSSLSRRVAHVNLSLWSHSVVILPLCEVSCMVVLFQPGCSRSCIMLTPVSLIHLKKLHRPCEEAGSPKEFWDVFDCVCGVVRFCSCSSGIFCTPAVMTKSMTWLGSPCIRRHCVTCLVSMWACGLSLDGSGRGLSHQCKGCPLL